MHSFIFLYFSELCGSAALAPKKNLLQIKVKQILVEENRVSSVSSAQLMDFRALSL